MFAPARRHQRGFSLVEILVGVSIGVIGILVMFRTVALWNTHTRTTTSGSDSQVSGTLAMFNLERDIKQAGMGFGRAKAPFMGCSVQFNDSVGPRAFNFPFLPVRIVPGAGGGADRIDTLYGNSSFYVEEQTFTASTSTTKTTKRRGGFRRGDVAVIAGDAVLPGSAPCAMVQITDDTNPDNQTLAHGTGNYVSFYTAAASGVARFNTAAGTGATFTSGRLYNLGPAPQLDSWQVVAGALTRTDLIQATAPLGVAENVVNLKAEYGIDTNADLIVDSWTTAAPANWTTVLAVRTAVLVRSKQYERTADPTSAVPVAVTSTNPSWAGGAFVMTNVDGTADAFGPTNDNPNNWRFYRYRVYERVIPLRNVIWGTAP